LNDDVKTGLVRQALRGFSCWFGLDWIHEHVENTKQHLSPDHAQYSTHEWGRAKSRVFQRGRRRNLIMLASTFPTKWPLNMNVSVLVAVDDVYECVKVLFTVLLVQ
jgi:hypothetical protein